MSLSTRDYNLIATALADAHAKLLANPYITSQLDALHAHRTSCESIATVLRAANQRFNREKFLAACVSKQD